MRFKIGGGSRWVRGGTSIGRGGLRGGVGIGPFSFTGGTRSKRPALQNSESSTPQPVSDTAFAIGVLLVALLIAALTLYLAAHLVAIFGLFSVIAGAQVKKTFERNTGTSSRPDGFAYLALRWGCIAALTSAVATQSWIWYLHDRRVAAVDEFCHQVSALTIVFCYPYTLIFGTSIYLWMVFNWTCFVLALVVAIRAGRVSRFTSS